MLIELTTYRVTFATVNEFYVSARQTFAPNFLLVSHVLSDRYWEDESYQYVVLSDIEYQFLLDFALDAQDAAFSGLHRVSRQQADLFYRFVRGLEPVSDHHYSSCDE